MMTLDEKVLDQAREARQRLVDLESQTAHARVDYHHAIKKLHAAGGSLREIAEALELSHQRVHQIVEGVPPAAGVQWVGRGRHRRRGKLHRGAFLVRFDAAARQVMVEAQAEADSLRHNYLGTEHIMLALLRRDVGGLGVEADAAKREIVERIGVGGDRRSGARLEPRLLGRGPLGRTREDRSAPGARGRDDVPAREPQGRE